MPKEYINPPQLFPSLQYGFSQIVSAIGGKTVYISGQVAWDEQQMIVGPGDLRTQTW
jgi:enamine deaminase RidA (YjgF/YER057c/UK114 family)